MGVQVEVIKASMFDKDREQIRAHVEKYTNRSGGVATKLGTFLFGANPIVMAYFAMVMSNKPVPMDLVEKANRALSGLVVSEDIVRAVMGPQAEWLPVLVVDPRFTGKACVPFVIDADGHLSLLALNLGQFVEAFGPDQLETLKGI